MFIEAEHFQNRGGWVVDQQFMDQMGSPYLLAHGLGRKVQDASTTFTVDEDGTYQVWVRTFNWTSPWSDAPGAGRFALTVNGKVLNSDLGTAGKEWMWQKAGSVRLKKNARQMLSLKDMTGFDGRCDAVYLTMDPQAQPPVDLSDLASWRKQKSPKKVTTYPMGQFDLVVVGGGIAGISAAVSAARLGLKVALVQDRPVVGGNNSSEVRVHLGGRIEQGRYPKLGGLQKEFGPLKGGNAQPAANYEDDKKTQWLAKEKNVTQFLGYHMDGVQMDGSRIRSVSALDIYEGNRINIEAPLFADCTGDGSLGFLSGADWTMGREDKSAYGEDMAQDVADDITLGASVQWYSKDMGKKESFPEFSYGLDFNDQSCEKVLMGEWTWETGMNYDMIEDFERIRDYGLMVIYSNWSFLKNHLKDNAKFRTSRLEWVAYVSGKRESRRLLGDYVLKQQDIQGRVFHEDGSFATTWSIDLHDPDPANTVYFPGQEFKSVCVQTSIYAYDVPYRCLYSRNVDNLFMAGRDISVTHVALGTTRVMRTCGMMGEVVGMAASICKKEGVTPRRVYQKHLPALQALMEKGVGGDGIENNQKYNQGSMLIAEGKTIGD